MAFCKAVFFVYCLILPLFGAISQFLVLPPLFGQLHTLDKYEHVLLRHYPRYLYSGTFQNSPLSIGWHNEVSYLA